MQRPHSFLVIFFIKYLKIGLDKIEAISGYYIRFFQPILRGVLLGSHIKQNWNPLAGWSSHFWYFIWIFWGKNTAISGFFYKPLGQKNPPSYQNKLKWANGSQFDGHNFGDIQCIFILIFWTKTQHFVDFIFEKSYLGSFGYS